MAVNQEVSTKVAELCVGAAGMASASAAGFAPIAIPIVALAAIGLHLRDGSAAKACKKAEKAVLKALNGSAEFSGDILDRAAALLKNADGLVDINPAELAEMAKQGDFTTRITATLIQRLNTAPDDHAVHRVLEACISAGISA